MSHFQKGETVRFIESTSAGNGELETVSPDITSEGIFRFDTVRSDSFPPKASGRLLESESPWRDKSIVCGNQQEGFPFAAEIVALYRADNSAREVANQLGVSKSHVLRVVNQAGVVRSQAVAQHLAAKKTRETGPRF